MTPEGKIKQKIKKLLDHDKIWYYMPVPFGYGATTIDFICAVRTRNIPILFTIEGKRPGASPTPRQELFMEDIRTRVNAKTWVIDDDISLERLRQWLHKMLSL